MKRHAALRDLSEDHHHGLVHARHLRLAAQNAEDQSTLLRVASEFLTFWHAHTNAHFREEEEVLLPFFARHGEMDQPILNQMLREHVLIRRHVLDLSAQMQTSTPQFQTVLAIGEQLDAHIRLEERQVFPLIEAAIPEDAMTQLATALNAWKNGAP
jgi:hemerythrin-like domain-containing protein